MPISNETRRSLPKYDVQSSFKSSVSYKLTKELGYTNDMIDEAEEKIDAEMRPQED